jgi:tetratricopeptide (TPR) repeat protein
VRSISLIALGFAVSLAGAQGASAEDDVIAQCHHDHDAMNWPSALASCSLALQSNSISIDEHALLLKNRGMSHYYMLDNDAALRDLDEVVRLKPGYEPGYNDRGLVHERRGEHRLAIRDFDRAIALTPDNGTPYYNRANTYQDSGDFRHAVADYTEAIRRQPNDPLELQARAYSYIRLGEFAQAVHDLDDAIALAPDNVSAYLDRSWAHALLGDMTGATQDCDRAALRDATARADLIGALNGRPFSCSLLGLPL